MKFADPLALTCPRCAAVSRHNSKDLLALTATCPACGSSLNEVGVRLGRNLDEVRAFAAWAEVLLCVEDRLGVSIADAEALDKAQRGADLTLRDLARLVSGYVPPGADSAWRALEVVLEAAATVARGVVAEADAERPLLEALRIPAWAARS
jgi:hypothetical protein